MKSLLKYTVYISLFFQIATGLLDVIALQWKISPDVNILRQALVLELAVQIIEGMFYIWLVFAIRRGATTNVTPKRYYDWFLTTPTMLFTLMVYLDYLKNNTGITTLKEFVKKHKETIASVVVLNAIMLILGYLGEINVLNTKTSVSLGFIPFVFYYALIYRDFVSPAGETIYWYFVVIWAIYGVAALLPYQPKNMMFNILDLFAKNFFGVYLSYFLYINRQ